MKYSSVIFIVVVGYASSQTINNVRLRNHADYMIEIITKTMGEMERRGWCNFKLPDYEEEVNEQVLNRLVTGQVRYTNGFVVSIQNLDIIESTVQQVWNTQRVTVDNVTTQIPFVSVRGTLRMQDVAIGYDVTAVLSDGKYRYTSVYLQPLISFAFSVNKNLMTEDIEVTVVGTLSVVRNVIPDIQPRDKISDILATLYNATAISSDGIVAWGSDILQPIAKDIVANQVKFPTICYNCPI